MRYNVLSHMTVRSLGPGKYADGQGLWLVKRDRQLGKWLLRLVVEGKRREMGLGRFPDVSIAEARESAAEARKQLRGGADPIHDRKKAKQKVKRLTLAEAIDSCFEARKAGLKNDGDAGRWMSPLSTHIVPKLGSRPVEEIDQHVLVEALSPLWHIKAEVARKALNRVNITLKHAAALGLNVDLTAAMKTRALLGKQRHQAEHIPSLHYAECPAFYRRLTDMSGVAALALRFVMLTAARSGEVRLATFSEIKDGVWHLAPDRTKNGREQRIPLSTEALAVAHAAQASSESELLFPSPTGKALSDAAMSALMKRESMEARPHGFRSSFRVWLEEKTDAPFELKESLLGHAVDTGVVGAYQRSDRLEKRRELLEVWEAYLSG